MAQDTATERCYWKFFYMWGLPFWLYLHCYVCKHIAGIWERLEMDWSINLGPASSHADSVAWGRTCYVASLMLSNVELQVKDEALVHDSYHCKNIPFGHWRPWPTQRERVKKTSNLKILEIWDFSGANNFVGSKVFMQWELTDPCPEECRPAQQKNWTIC